MKLAFRPKDTAINKAIQVAFVEDYPQYAGDTKPPRRITSELPIPRKAARPVLIRESLAGKVEYQLHLRPEDLLTGPRAMLGNYQVLLVVAWAIALFNAALKHFLPSLDEGVLASLSDNDFQLISLTTCKYVEFDSEAKAMQAILMTYAHCKITLDNGVVIPKRKSDSNKRMPIVIADEKHRNAFVIVLPYGEIKVYLIRDNDEYPETFQYLKDVDSRMAMRARTRTLLCFEMTNDLAHFHYWDDDGTCHRLPEDYRNWTKSNLPCSPHTIFWKQAHFEMWLNVEIATTEEEVRRDGLSPYEKQVLDAYLAGTHILSRNLLPEHHDEAMAIHEALVTKAGVNILTPWATNKLHKGKLLRELLGDKNLLDPGTDSDFEAHTLGNQNTKAAVTAFCPSMDGIAGWLFKPQ
jgi:hypothetical protein